MLRPIMLSLPTQAQAAKAAGTAVEYATVMITSGDPGQRVFLAERCWIDKDSNVVCLRFRHSEAWAMRRNGPVVEFASNFSGFFVRLSDDAQLFSRQVLDGMIAASDAARAESSTGLPRLSPLTLREAESIMQSGVDVSGQGARLFALAERVVASKQVDASARDTDRAVVDAPIDRGVRPALPLKHNRRKETTATYVPLGRVTQLQLFAERIEQLEYRLAALEAQLESDLQAQGLRQGADVGPFYELRRWTIEQIAINFTPEE